VGSDASEKLFEKTATVESKVTVRGSFRLYRIFGRHYRPYAGILAVAYLCLFAGLAMAALAPWPLKLVLDHVILGREVPESARFLEALAGGDRRVLLGILAVSIILIAALEAVFSYVNKYWVSSTGDRMSSDIRERVFGHLQRLSLSFHDSARSGNLVYTLTSDTKAMKGMLVDFPQDLSQRLGGFVLYAGLMLALDLRLGLIAMSALPLIALVSRVFDGRMKGAMRESRDQEGTVASIASETLSSIAVVQAYGQEHEERRRFETKGHESLEARLRAVRLQRTYGRLVDFLVVLATAGVLFDGGRRALAGELLPGTLVVFMAYIKSLYGSFERLSTMFLSLARSQACAERIAEIVESDMIDHDAADARALPAVRGRIEFRDVTFRYRGGAPVLKDLSFVAEPGQTVALVGHSGSGKSTLISLLLRFYDPQRGVVAIDGEDVRRFTRRSVRDQITVVLQEAHIFRQSVAENIAFGREGATREEVVEAAKLAEAHDFIARLPEGYDTRLEQGGGDLSGGQRQRIHIARALVRRAPIVILDEPATGLDAVAEAKVNAAIRRLTRGRTTFIIAHKLSTLVHADRILVLEDGAIASQGTHDELMKTCPVYQELVALEFGMVHAAATNGASRNGVHAVNGNGVASRVAEGAR
jgi:ATP-binding cassette, subfamily B, bacterial